MERVKRALETPMTIADQPMTMNASIGIAVSDAGATDAGSLLRIADQAMYLEKKRRRQEGKH